MSASVEVDVDKADISLTSSKNIPSERELQLWQTAMTTDVLESSIIHGVTEGTVRSAMKKVEKLLASEVAMKASSLKLRMHLELETVKKEAWKGWKRSIGKKTSTKTKTKRTELTDILEESGVDDAEQVEVETIEKEDAGDSRFLSAVQKAIEGQMALWPGVQAPRANAITGPNGDDNPTLTIKLEEMTDDQLQGYFEVYKANPNIIDIS